MNVYNPWARTKELEKQNALLSAETKFLTSRVADLHEQIKGRDVEIEDLVEEVEL